jgi:ATP-dependent exoDNAse (exonuclease V) alpha subunit
MFYNTLMTQDEALDLLKLGHNVYLTGPAGSGKTYLLNKYIEYLKKNNVSVGITASTGIAATHLNGTTIHSWSGIGIKDKLGKQDINDLKNKIYLQIRFSLAKILIIDEISMLHGYRLDMIDQVCKAFKISSEPFGGLQVVMCGDFFQLPPVARNGEDDSFVYKSSIWNQMNLKVCYLEEQYRQSDLGFLQVLNDIRGSSVTGKTLEILMTRHNKEVDGIGTPTKLYTHNADVDAINNMELAKVNGEPHIYDMTSRGEQKLVEIIKKSCLAPEQLILKKKAVVMFVKNNFDKGYVNGTLGTIVGFDKEKYPIVKILNGKKIIAEPANWIIEEEGIVKAQISQIPLRLAWAITVHKSQGMSLDAAQIDLSKSFVTGMGYVALSRVRALTGMKLIGINEMALKVNEEVVEVDHELKKQSGYDKGVVANLPKGQRIKLQKKFLESVSNG